MYFKMVSSNWEYEKKKQKPQNITTNFTVTAK